jgi:hypothetical protein
MAEFKVPFHELENRFTTSEIAIMSWKSMEDLDSLRKKTDNKAPDQQDVYRMFEETTGVQVGKPNTEVADIDLRKMKGKDVLRFFSSQGLHFMPNMVTRGKGTQEA